MTRRLTTTLILLFVFLATQTTQAAPVVKEGDSVDRRSQGIAPPEPVSE